MATPDEVLDALWRAALAGDAEAAAFLRVFGPWVMRGAGPVDSHVDGDR
ncbi:hypothetical protein [Lysobacter sp. HA35]